MRKNWNTYCHMPEIISNLMNTDVHNLDLESLKRLYQSKVDELMNNLREDVSWDYMKELRETLYELSLIMYEKVQSSDPSEKSKSCKT